ncbi:MAG: T6SS immunity protein Tli4 family protein [Pseudomonas sp.]|nr:T6SS immunity protein Tli4 family protein [Pseudomonas sp.]
MSRLTAFVLCLLLWSLTGCTHTPTELETRTVNEQTTKMRTWALGRGLIDLPSTWDNNTGDVILYYGLGADHATVEVQVLGEGVTPQRFEAALDERAARIAAVKNYEKSNIPMLVSAQALGQRNKLLQYYKSMLRPQTFVHELHLLVDDVYVLLKADSYNGVIAPVESRLKKLATQIFKVTPQNAGPGFALGPIVIRSDHDQEIATFYFGPPASDLRMEIYVNALSPGETQRLLARTKEDTEIFLANDYDKLRAGSTTLAGMQAEEFLIGFSDETHRQLLFLAENYRDNPSFSSPSLNIRMAAGGMTGEAFDPDEPEDLVRWTLPNFVPKPHQLPLWQQPPAPEPVNPSLTDYEATAVWDAIVSSVRMRYGAVAPRRPEPTYPIFGPTPEEAAANRRALDAFLATDENGMPWKPKE